MHLDVAGKAIDGELLVFNGIEDAAIRLVRMSAVREVTEPCIGRELREEVAKLSRVYIVEPEDADSWRVNDPRVEGFDWMEL